MSDQSIKKINMTTYLLKKLTGSCLLMILLLAGDLEGQTMALSSANLQQTTTPTTRKVTSLSMTEALHYLERKFNVNFSYLADLKSISSVKADDIMSEDLETALRNVFINTNYEFRQVDEGFYVIYSAKDHATSQTRNSDKPEAGTSDVSESFQARETYTIPQISRLEVNGFALDLLKRPTISISGKITDSEGQPLIGATVLVKGKTMGTATDLDGSFQLDGLGENETLVISYTGFQTLEVPVEGKTSFSITLYENALNLNEVVVVGFGTQKKVNLTGAVDVISNELIQDRNASSVSQLLVGAAVGASFGVDKNGYQPGSKASIDIRGIGSLNGGAPYVLIDGFEGDMNSLNPDDIESISILKDAAASAIYGARAPFGVILITTKSGKKNKKLSASYSGSLNLVTPARLPGTLDSYTFARVTNEANLNKNASLYYSEETVDRIIAYQEGNYDYLRSTFPSNFPTDRPITDWQSFPTDDGGWAGTNNGHADNDFWDDATGPAWGHSHSFSVQGGSENTSYYLSAGFTNQVSTFEWADDYFKRLNLTAKIKTSIADWWDVRYESRFTKSNRFFPSASRPETQDSYNALFHIIYNTPPTQPQFSSFGDPLQSNVIQFFEAGNSDDQTTESWQIVGTELRPAKGWKVNSDFAYKTTDFYGIHDGQPFNQENWLTGLRTQSWYGTQVNEYHQSNLYWSSNTYTSYEWSLNNNHNFMVMGGMQFEAAEFRGLDAQAQNLIVPEIISITTATGAPSLRESLSHWATEGFFGRLTYNYKEKYLLESNVRYDGTSRFLEGKRWGFFPSFSGGWVVSAEDFWQGISPAIGFFKIRASWGKLGNQNVAAYQDLALIQLSKSNLNWLPGNNQVGQVGYTQTPGLVSPFLTWETAASTNLGLNMGLLNDQLQVNFDWFQRNTTDMIGPSETLPGVLGASVPQSNNASLRTRGWEVALNWKDYVSEDLSYFANINVYDSKSIVTKYNNPTGFLGNWRVGQDIGEIWGWNALSLFQTQAEIDAHADQSFIFNVWNTGDVKYEDVNGDGKIDNGSNTIDDHGDRVLIGNSNPRYQFGISGGFSYKAFDFSMLWRGVAKREKAMTSNDYGYYGFYRTGWSQPKDDHLDYFRDQPGTKYVGLHEGEANINKDAFYPRPYLDAGSSLKNQNANSRYLGDFSYIRLQNVQVGYSIPPRIASKLNLTKFRVFISGDNLLTLDHLPKGIDPTLPFGGYRGGTGKDYRADRIYSFGLSLNY